jgi:hypothetical protein
MPFISRYMNPTEQINVPGMPGLHLAAQPPATPSPASPASEGHPAQLAEPVIQHQDAQEQEHHELGNEHSALRELREEEKEELVKSDDPEHVRWGTSVHGGCCG